MNDGYSPMVNKFISPLLVLSMSLLVVGCGGGVKKKPQQTAVPMIEQLEDPSLYYLLAPTNDSVGNMTVAQWTDIAKINYESMKYGRALRAATEALKIDDDAVEARQLAMLAAVKITESNVGSFHDNALMNSDDKAILKTTLTNITTSIGASD